MGEAILTRRGKAAEPILDGSSSALAAPSTKYLIDNGITTDGVYWIDVPNEGPLQVYCDLSIDNIGWMLMHSNYKEAPAGASPPRSSVADYGRTSSFWSGTAGSNQSFVFDGQTLTTATTEALIRSMPYKKIKMCGYTTSDAATTVPWNGGDVADSTTAFAAEAKAYSKYTYGKVEGVSVDGTTSHAQKVAGRQGWSRGFNDKKALTWDATWSHSYNAGAYLLGWPQVAGPAYGDYYYVYFGGNSDRKSLSSALWRNINPQSGISYSLHNSPTSIDCSLGRSGHRGGGNSHNDSWWIQQEAV